MNTDVGRTDAGETINSITLTNKEITKSKLIREEASISN